jgi:hypothetical protein
MCLLSNCAYNVGHEQEGLASWANMSWKAAYPLEDVRWLLHIELFLLQKMLLGSPLVFF